MPPPPPAMSTLPAPWPANAVANARGMTSALGPVVAVPLAPNCVTTSLLIWPSNVVVPGKVNDCQCNERPANAGSLGMVNASVDWPLPSVSAKYHSLMRSTPTDSERESAASTSAIGVGPPVVDSA